MRRSWRAALAAVAAFAVAVLGVVVPLGAASAVSAGGVTLTLDYGGETYDGHTVVAPGQSYRVTMQYDTTVVEPGSSVAITVPAGVSIPESALQVPPGNTVIESTVLDGDQLVVTFQDPMDTSAAQGVYAITFTFEEPEDGSELRDVTWSLEGQSTTDELIVRQPGDDFRPEITDSEGKSVQAPNLNAHVTVAEDGTVTVAEAITGVAIPYTLRIDSADARDGVTITDSIDDFLSFDADSFVATLVTWDENGLNRDEREIDLPVSVDGSTFQIAGLDIPANSYLTISYSASVTDVEGLEAELQPLADAIDEYDGGWFSTDLANTAEIDGTPGTATVTVGAHRPAAPTPDYGAAFGKASDPSGRLTVELDDDGALAGPIDVEYTLRADLTQFAGFEGRYELDRNVVISDVLPEQIRWLSDEDDFLTVVAGGLQLTRAEGEHTPESFAADEFVGQYAVSGGQLLINVGKDTTRAHEFSVQAQIVDLAPNGWQDGEWYRYTGLANTAVFHYGDGDTVERSVSHPMQTPAPDPAAAFGKSSDVDFHVVVALDEDGDLAEPVDMSYTLTADLTEFAAFAGKYFALDRNVVVVDELPAQMEWTQDVLTVVAPEGLTLERVEGVSEEDFAGDDYVGTYQVVDRRLMVNLGQDLDTRYELDVSARLTTVEGLRRQDLPTGDGWPKYTETGFTGLTNEAAFHYREGGPAREDRSSHRLVVPMDPSQGITDPEVFDKTMSDETLNVRPGQTVEVPFGFTAAAGAVPDLGASRIVDDVDPDVFDLSDLDAIRDSITGTYNWQGPLTGSDFELEIDAEGNLVVTLSDTFGQNLPEWARPDLDEPLTERLAIELTLPTHPVQGKQVLTIVNSARLIGGDDDGIVWDAEATGSATTYGDELEVRKSIYRGSGEWTQNLRVELDEHGELTQDEFIYRVELIPHGTYQGVAIIPMADVLPEELEYIGFVAEGDLDTGAVTPGDTVDMGGNVVAAWDAETRTLEIQQREGTVFRQGQPVLVNYKVTLSDFTENVPVTNYVSNSSATITPTNGYPLLVQKVDTEDEDVVITDRDARFTITGPGGDVVTDAAYVVAGRLMVAGDDGGDVGIVVDEPGRYEVTETVPPAGYQLSDATVAITVDDEGNSAAVTFYNVPEPPQVSVGDYVWVDTDRDGTQDEGEPGIPGVTLVLTGPDGEPVTDVYGNPVEPTVTDEDGFYTFAGLPVLEEGQSYTVSIDRDASADALAPYIPTLEGAGDDPAADSSTWEASSTGLTQDGDRDPTLDFGFVRPMVSVGDYVWVDTDRDGVQDEGESGIPGVTLVLTGPDGKPVTDVFGNPVEPTVTDEDGFYTFEGLPALEDGQSYTVTVDRDASAEVLAPYIPTLEGAGDDPAVDSSTWTATSVALTKDGDRDPTLDFGFVRPMVSLGDYVWVDTDRDGVQDEGEPGIPGVTLVLTGPDGKPVIDVYGNLVEPTVTDEDGFYTFEGLPALEDGQSYTVSIDREASADALAPYIPTLEGAGDDPAADSSTWEASSTGLTQDGDRDPTLDFGFVRPMVSVGDYVWEDVDRDGVQDEGEPGIPGVTLVLTGPDGEPVTDVYGNLVEPTVTDENGSYTFEGLPVLEDGQSYTVTIDRDASAEALRPYQPTVEQAGEDPAADSSTWEASSTGLTEDGDRDPTLDFGFVRPMVSVGDYVWVDTDRDGVQDEGEPGIPGVTLVLTGPDGKPVTDVYGNLVEPAVTDENGRYSFDGLPVLSGDEVYTVSIDREASAEALAPYIPTLEGAGDDPAVDSSTWTTTSATLTEDGERDPTLDFGFVRPMVSLGDLVWVDTDRDGVQDEGEPGIPGVTLVLTGPDGKPVTDVYGNPVEPTVTDENGSYTFEGLPALEDGQSYTVSIDREASAEALAPYVPTLEGAGDDAAADSSTWEASSTGLTEDGDRDPTLDFGFVRPMVSVGDYVWVDTDRDGIQDQGEPGIPGVTLVLTGPDGKPVTDVYGNLVEPTVTDKDGFYTFEGLPVLEEGQSYTVSIDRDASAEALAPYVPTLEGAGNDPAVDSSTWTATSVALTKDGDRDATLDFGFMLPAEPAEPADPDEPGTEDVTPSVPQDPAGTDDSLPVTGAAVGGPAVVALLLLLGGGAVLRSRMRTD